METANVMLKARYYYIFLFRPCNFRKRIKLNIYFCYNERKENKETEKEREKESYRNIKHVNMLFMSFEK